MKYKLLALLSFLLLFSLNSSFSQDVQTVTVKVEDIFTAFKDYCPVQVGDLFYIDKVAFEDKNLYYALSERKKGIFDVDSSAIKDIAYEVLGHMGEPAILFIAAGYGIIIDINKGDKTERITMLPGELNKNVIEASHRLPTIDIPVIYPSLESLIKEMNSSCPKPLTLELNMTSVKLDSVLRVEISVLEQGTENTKLDDIKSFKRDYIYRALGFFSALAEEDEYMKYIFKKIQEKEILIKLIFKGNNTGRTVEMDIHSSSLIFIGGLTE